MFDSLLDILHAIWLLLLIAILMTPIIPGMKQAGLYGKLRQQHKKGMGVGVGVGEEGQDEQKRQEQKASSSSSSAFLHFFLDSPYLAIPTATAFRAYYVFAALWNGILLYDVVTISLTSSYEGTLVLHSLHDLAHTSGWFRYPTTTTATTIDSPLTRSSDASLAPMMLHIALFELHFVRRVYESYYVAAFSKQSTQHLLVTIMGLFYYFLCVLTPIIDSPLLCETHPGGWFGVSTCTILIGCTLFVAGSYGQYDAHRRLAALRRGKKVKVDDEFLSPSSSSYSIPFGGLFDFVSMPHYFCEMVLYTGLALLTGGKLSQLCVCLWVYINLSLTGIRSHRWYQKQFPNYPNQRKAVIPFIM